MTATVQDGGFAWLLCAAAFFNVVIYGGFLTSGVFYIMFKEALEATDTAISLITAINTCLMHFICPFTGLLSERYGIRCVAMMGAILSTAGLAGAAFSTQIYHLYISYGIFAGMGLGMVFTCSNTIVNPYFNKYKRTACAIITTGSGVGAFIIPPVLKCLEDTYGWRGAILLMAAINAHILVFSSLFRPLRGTTSPKAQLKQNQNEKEQQSKYEIKLLSKETDTKIAVESQDFRHKIIKLFSLFKIIPFLCLCLLALVRTFPYSIIITHFGSHVLTNGFSREDVVKLYMTFGICSTVSRLLIGFVAQATNVNTGGLIMVTIVLNGILTMAVPFMNQLWMLYVYAVVFQILMAPYHALQAVIVMEHVPASKVALAFGLFQFVYVPGHLLGAPISDWLYQYTEVYTYSFLLAGGLIILAGLTMAPAAYHINKTRAQPIEL